MAANQKIAELESQIKSQKVLSSLIVNSLKQPFESMSNALHENRMQLDEAKSQIGDMGQLLTSVCDEMVSISAMIEHGKDEFEFELIKRLSSIHFSGNLQDHLAPLVQEEVKMDWRVDSANIV